MKNSRPNSAKVTGSGNSQAGLSGSQVLSGSQATSQVHGLSEEDQLGPVFQMLTPEEEAMANRMNDETFGVEADSLAHVEASQRIDAVGLTSGEVERLLYKSLPREPAVARGPDTVAMSPDQISMFVTANESTRRSEPPKDKRSAERTGKASQTGKATQSGLGPSVRENPLMKLVGSMLPMTGSGSAGVLGAASAPSSQPASVHPLLQQLQASSKEREVPRDSPQGDRAEASAGTNTAGRSILEALMGPKGLASEKAAPAPESAGSAGVKQPDGTNNSASSKSVTSKQAPVKGKAEPVSKSEPVVAKSEAAVSKPAPVVSNSAPVVGKSASVVSKSAPVVSKPPGNDKSMPPGPPPPMSAPAPPTVNAPMPPRLNKPEGNAAIATKEKLEVRGSPKLEVRGSPKLPTTSDSNQIPLGPAPAAFVAPHPGPQALGVPSGVKPSELVPLTPLHLKAMKQTGKVFSEFLPPASCQTEPSNMGLMSQLGSLSQVGFARGRILMTSQNVDTVHRIQLSQIAAAISKNGGAGSDPSTAHRPIQDHRGRFTSRQNSGRATPIRSEPNSGGSAMHSGGSAMQSGGSAGQSSGGASLGSGSAGPSSAGLKSSPHSGSQPYSSHTQSDDSSRTSRPGTSDSGTGALGKKYYSCVHHMRRLMDMGAGSHEAKPMSSSKTTAQAGSAMSRTKTLLAVEKLYGLLCEVAATDLEIGCMHQLAGDLISERIEHRTQLLEKCNEQLLGMMDAALFSLPKAMRFIDEYLSRLVEFVEPPALADDADDIHVKQAVNIKRHGSQFVQRYRSMLDRVVGRSNELLGD